jgi:dTDP-glucose 4,6-dehydratase
MKVIVTGGCGFIGHHMVEHILVNTDWDIDIIDSLTYASFGFERLKSTRANNNSRVRVFTNDITLPISGYLLKELQKCDYIIHMGAETHVDNSIANPIPFVMSNVVGTMNILEFARKCPNLKRIIYFSTDEVFGSSDKRMFPDGFSEWDRYNSSNPYSASKASGEELSLAWCNTYKLPLSVIHCMNSFGERQHVEKFIPRVIKTILNNGKVSIHTSNGVPGSRNWIHARNVAAATLFIMKNGAIGDKYNIAGDNERSNLEMAQFIADIMDRPLEYEMVEFYNSRPGGDFSYSLNGAKLRDMGFRYPVPFKDSLVKMIEWTVSNPKWLEE